jgi:phi LC3 family holin
VLKFNWKIRKENIVFVVQILLAILTPIFAYAGITAADVTTWPMLGKLLLDAVSNPYVLALVAVSVWNAVNDPTSPGLGDSSYALGKNNLTDVPTDPRAKAGC